MWPTTNGPRKFSRRDAFRAFNFSEHCRELSVGKIIFERNRPEFSTVLIARAIRGMPRVTEIREISLSFREFALNVIFIFLVLPPPGIRAFDRRKKRGRERGDGRGKMRVENERDGGTGSGIFYLIFFATPPSKHLPPSNAKTNVLVARETE